MTILTPQKIEQKYIDEIRELYTKFPDFPMPDLSLLPGNGLDGWMVLKDDKVIAACYAYIASNSPVSWLEWIVADKDYKGPDKSKVIQSLIEHACLELKECGYLYVFGMTTNKLLEDIYVRAGFDDSGPQGKELIKTLH